ncbi:HalOD1 output domain-containing protein [Halovivax limisalsi]|uniref:HalOD1 output domain-containing protein n=1 Tax=Halovivax limisalsi TaxID=1453760 RepID=UPI001FFDD3DA|nr:HalOD1 output domain-containing protein [Halovivax limisalsi]
MPTSTTNHGPRDRDLVVAITDAIADATGREPFELEPLYETIDPEALSALFAERETADVSITFQYEGHAVRIDEAADVHVDAAPPN